MTRKISEDIAHVLESIDGALYSSALDDDQARWAAPELEPASKTAVDDQLWERAAQLGAEVSAEVSEATLPRAVSEVREAPLNHVNQLLDAMLAQREVLGAESLGRLRVGVGLLAELKALATQALTASIPDGAVLGALYGVPVVGDDTLGPHDWVLENRIGEQVTALLSIPIQGGPFLFHPERVWLHRRR